MSQPRGASRVRRVTDAPTCVEHVSTVTKRVVTALADNAIVRLSPRKNSRTSQVSPKLSLSERMGLKQMNQPQNSQYPQKDGDGAAFYNNRKKNERQPDWTGTFTWEGAILELAMWERQSKKDGTPYLKFQVKPKFVPRQQQEAPPPPRVVTFPSRKAEPATEINDDIPF